MSAAPTCRSSDDLARLNGQVVRLVGTYRKKMDAVAMARPGRKPPDPVFRGYVAIELSGSPERYDPQKAAGDPTLVQLGREPRPADELQRLLDKPVAVQGRLLLDPDSLLSEAELEQARPAAIPLLLDPTDLTALP